MPKTVEDKVQAVSIAVSCQQPEWDLHDDLWDGTEAMRRASVRWLPREPKEEDSAYGVRLEHSFLYPGLRSAINDLTDRPFGRQLTVIGKTPDKLNGMLTNCDGSGSSLHNFAKAAFAMGIKRGMFHVLVDFPVVPEGATLEQDGEPYFVLIDPRQVIGWRINPVDQSLESVRIYSCETEPVGEFGEKQVERIRVWTKTTVTVYTKDGDSDNWIQGATISHTFGSVPLSTTYFCKKEQMVAERPLKDLAEVNLTHWQSSSAQRNSLRFARIGLLVAKGFSQEEYDEGFTIGPSRVIKSTNSDADISYVEHSGKAIEIGRTDLKDLETLMEILGVQPVLEKRQDSTATGQRINADNEQSSLKAWIHDAERGLQQCCTFYAKWKNIELPKDWNISIYSDFSASANPTDLTVLSASRLDRQISQRTYLEELKRRNVLAGNVDVDRELEETASELTTPDVPQ